MAFTLFPKNIRFFELFAQQQQQVAAAAEALVALCGADGDPRELCGRINTLETDGNALAREIARLLADTFITPIEREDVFRIATGYEEILNDIRAVAVRIGLYRSRSQRAALRELLGDFGLIIGQCGMLLDGIAHDRYAAAPMQEVIRLKAESDHLLVTAMGELHECVTVDSDVLTGAQILDRCEMLLAATERFAYLLEAIGIKNA
ncbi:MAG TPA: DUF47 family protein [bacterium]|nr:DUF47 family protein [bacterium]